jgi:hypothetical protein
MIIKKGVWGGMTGYAIVNNIYDKQQWISTLTPIGR